MESDVFGIQLVVAYLSVHGVQLLKRFLPGLADPRLARFVGALVAGLATVGITMQVTGSFHAGGQIIITYPPIDVLLHCVVAWIFQHVIYNGAVQKKPVQG